MRFSIFFVCMRADDCEFTGSVKNWGLTFKNYKCLWSFFWRQKCQFQTCNLRFCQYLTIILTLIQGEPWRGFGIYGVFNKYIRGWTETRPRKNCYNIFFGPPLGFQKCNISKNYKRDNMWINCSFFEWTNFKVRCHLTFRNLALSD